MDDQTVDSTVETGSVPVEDVQTNASDVTVNTEQGSAQAEHMIPKSRFDEINNQLKALKAEQDKATKEAEAAQVAQLEEQNKYKELYEKAQADAAAAAEQLAATQLQNLRQSIGSELGLPSALIPRLSGSNDEEIRADAQTLLEALPKPAAPNVGNQTGSGNAPQNGGLSDLEKSELAAVFGVNPQFIS